MNKFLLSVVLILCSFTGHAQQVPATSSVDTQFIVNLGEVDVTARWKNDTERYRYNQEKFYVTTVMPYVNAASKLFKEVDAKSEEPGLTRKEWKRFISGKEEEMRTRFEDKVKELNVTQGALLVKLIARQTNLNIYVMLKEFKNPLTAIKWQAWARVNGMNLDKKYHPEEERTLELIMDDLGYPLPASYALANADK